MREIILHLFEILATYVEVSIGMRICGIICSEKSTSESKNILSSSIITVVVWLLNQYQLFSVGITSVAIIGITICTYSMYKKLNIEGIFVAILYFVLVYIVDFLSITFVGILVGKTELANSISKAYSVERIYLCCASYSMTLY